MMALSPRLTEDLVGSDKRIAVEPQGSFKWDNNRD